MKFEIIGMKRQFKILRFEKIILEGMGSGTSEDPIILDATYNLPSMFRIQDSNLHVNFIGLEQWSIYVHGSKNITFRNVTFKYLLLQVCSNCKIEKVSNSRYLKLYLSSNNEINECKLSKIRFHDSSFNKIRNCEIKKIKMVGKSKLNEFV